jgi:hypothetical protein
MQDILNKCINRKDEIMEKLSNEQLGLIEDLEKKITQGDWLAYYCRDGVYADKKCLVGTKFDRIEIVGVRQIGRPQHTKEIEDNAEFIALVRNSIKSMISEIKEYRLKYSD